MHPTVQYIRFTPYYLILLLHPLGVIKCTFPDFPERHTGIIVGEGTHCPENNLNIGLSLLEPMQRYTIHVSWFCFHISSTETTHSKYCIMLHLLQPWNAWFLCRYPYYVWYSAGIRDKFGFYAEIYFGTVWERSQSNQCRHWQMGEFHADPNQAIFINADPEPLFY